MLFKMRTDDLIYQDRLGTNTQPQFQGDPCCTGVEAFDLVYDSFAKQLGENQLIIQS